MLHRTGICSNLPIHRISAQSPFYSTYTIPHHLRIDIQPMIDELQVRAKILHQAGKANEAAALHQQVLTANMSFELAVSNKPI
ncbi:MAG: hypothetical protein ACJAVV_003666 [Alphaproteobacteria bacterium]